MYVLEAGLELGDIVRNTVDNNAFRKLVQGVLYGVGYIFNTNYEVVSGCNGNNKVESRVIKDGMVPCMM